MARLGDHLIVGLRIREVSRVQDDPMSAAITWMVGSYEMGGPSPSDPSSQCQHGLLLPSLGTPSPNDHGFYYLQGRGSGLLRNCS